MRETCPSNSQIADLTQQLASIGFPDVASATLERCLKGMGQDLVSLIDRTTRLASGAGFEAARRDVRRVLVCASPLVTRVVELLKMQIPLMPLVAASQRDAQLLRRIKQIDDGDGSHVGRVVASLTSCLQAVVPFAWEVRGPSTCLGVATSGNSIGWRIVPIGISGLADFGREVVVPMPSAAAAQLVGVLTGLSPRVRVAGVRYAIELRRQEGQFLISIDERRAAIARVTVNHAEAARLALLIARCSSDL